MQAEYSCDIGILASLFPIVTCLAPVSHGPTQRSPQTKACEIISRLDPTPELAGWAFPAGSACTVAHEVRPPLQQRLMSLISSSMYGVPSGCRMSWNQSAGSGPSCGEPHGNRVCVFPPTRPQE